MKTTKCEPNFGSIPILVVQLSDQLIISMDAQSYWLISGSIHNFKTSKCMHPIQMKDTLRGFFNLEAQFRLVAQQSGQITICVDP
jgi:hypothetical protein